MSTDQWKTNLRYFKIIISGFVFKYSNQSMQLYVDLRIIIDRYAFIVYIITSFGKEHDVTIDVTISFIFQFHANRVLFYQRIIRSDIHAQIVIDPVGALRTIE